MAVLRTPSRNSDTISAGVSSSIGSQRWDGSAPARSPRSICAAMAGGRASSSALGLEQRGERTELGRPRRRRRSVAIDRRAGAGHQLPDVVRSPLHDRDRLLQPRVERQSRDRWRRAPARRAPDRTQPRSPRATSASLSGKTRKIVPSAMPAASAISRVVTPVPCSQHQRQRRPHDRRPPLGGRQRGGAGRGHDR